MSTTAFTPIPLGLDDFVQGGLLSDVPVEIIEIQFRGFDYGGSVQKDILSVWMKLALLDDNLKRTNDEPVENFWSAGGELEEVAVSSDGFQVGILPNSGAKTAMTKGSNFEILLLSLTKPALGGPAMPKNWLRDNQSSLKCLLGTKFHIFRTPAPRREGIDTSGRKRKDFEPTIATATKVYYGPWAPKAQTSKVQRAEAAAAGTAPAAVNGSPAPDTSNVNGAAGGADELTTQAISTVQSVLKENPILASVEELKVACFRQHAKTKADTRNGIVKLVSDVAWLKSNGFKVADDGLITA